MLKIKIFINTATTTWNYKIANYSPLLIILWQVLKYVKNALTKSNNKKVSIVVNLIVVSQVARMVSTYVIYIYSIICISIESHNRLTKNKKKCWELSVNHHHCCCCCCCCETQTAYKLHEVINENYYFFLMFFEGVWKIIDMWHCHDFHNSAFCDKT